MTDGQWARGGPDEIEVFATGATTMVEVQTGDPDQHHDDDHDRDQPSVTELLRRGGATLQGGYEHAKDLQARPGHRPGVRATGAAARRRGGGTDIVRPVAVNPAAASAAAVSGALFDGSIPHLHVDHDDHDALGNAYLVWPSTVTHRRGRGVPTTLHLLASPSMVVTVLELVPQRRVRWKRRRFIRDGIAALDALALRLEVAERPAA